LSFSQYQGEEVKPECPEYEDVAETEYDPGEHGIQRRNNTK
jgi:hypothetical protein